MKCLVHNWIFVYNIYLYLFERALDRLRILIMITRLPDRTCGTGSLIVPRGCACFSITHVYESHAFDGTEKTEEKKNGHASIFECEAARINQLFIVLHGYKHIDTRSDVVLFLNTCIVFNATSYFALNDYFSNYVQTLNSSATRLWFFHQECLNQKFFLFIINFNFIVIFSITFKK